MQWPQFALRAGRARGIRLTLSHLTQTTRKASLIAYPPHLLSRGDPRCIVFHSLQDSDDLSDAPGRECPAGVHEGLVVVKPCIRLSQFLLRRACGHDLGNNRVLSGFQNAAATSVLVSAVMDFPLVDYMERLMRVRAHGKNRSGRGSVPFAS